MQETCHSEFEPVEELLVLVVHVLVWHSGRTADIPPAVSISPVLIPRRVIFLVPVVCPGSTSHVPRVIVIDLPKRGLWVCSSHTGVGCVGVGAQQ